MSASPRQIFYSDRQENTLDEKSRTLKAKKILAVLNDYVTADMRTWRCLDIGCSGGIISCFMGGVFRQVIGIDMDVKALDFARQYNDRSNVSFIQSSGCALPVGAAEFDVVICNHVYEHVPDARQLFDQVHRVLRPGGVCYLACTNKYWVLEPHYNLPFLSWLPRPLSNMYLRLTGKGHNYQEQLLSRTQVLKLVRRFQVTEYTLPIVRSPEKFHVTDIARRWSATRHLPASMARVFLFWMPTFIWILQKPGHYE